MSNELIYKAGTFALISIGILALSAVYFLFKGIHKSEQRTFSVDGSADVYVKPNKGSVSATFYAEAADEKKARDEMAKKVQKMLDGIEGMSSMKIEKKDIQTQTVNIQPKYEYCSGATWRDGKPCTGEPKVVGFTATQNVVVKISKNEDGLGVEDKAGKVLGIMPEFGARETSGPNWETDTKAAVEEARAAATAEARKKAESIAASLGARLGKVVSYSESTGGGMPIPYMMRGEMKAGMAMDSVKIPVSAGEDKVTLTVNVVYELK